MQLWSSSREKAGASALVSVLKALEDSHLWVLNSCIVCN